MMNALVFPGHVWDVDLPPTLNNGALAGTHLFVVIASDDHGVIGFACTSNIAKQPGHYTLERAITGLPKDTVVVTTLPRRIPWAIWNRGRSKLTLPRPLLQDICRSGRRALRHAGMAHLLPSFN